VVPSPREFRYRNRVSFALRRLRGGAWSRASTPSATPAAIVDLDGRCLLPEEAIAAPGTASRRLGRGRATGSPPASGCG
jgi:hypothetical protein